MDSTCFFDKYSSFEFCNHFHDSQYILMHLYNHDPDHIHYKRTSHYKKSSPLYNHMVLF